MSRAPPADLVFTIDSDDESIPESPELVPQKQVGKSNSKTGKVEADTLDPDFEFDLSGGAGGLGEVEAWGGDEVVGGEVEDGKQLPLNVDDIIARRAGKPLESYAERKRKRNAAPEEDGEASESGSAMSQDEDEEEEGDGGEWDGIDVDSDDGSEAFGAGVPVGREEDEDESDDEAMELDAAADEEPEEEEDEEEEESDSDAESEPETAAELARKSAFFSADPTASTSTSKNAAHVPDSFASMNLSRPLLRALTALSLNTPTPIQARSIPLALLGRDILGSAVTGSGKTAAFMIPVLERLAYRDRSKGGQACRVLVLCPTRELAVQCEAVGRALVEKGGLDIRLALLVGGLSLSAQAHTLRTLPDILIATPGRLIDHLTNTPSFTLSALDVLIIDEADRMLEAGFNDELEEIIKACPRTRQTMLFSATMTDSVDELVKLSLDRPVRVFVDPKKSTAAGLIQEFVRVRERNGEKGEEKTRAACLVALCKRTVRERCIVFFRSKALAHQMRVVFGLSGMKAAELHGNLTQEQRLQALTDFKTGKVDYLLATDLASRGLDIKGVETVINYDMPGQLAQYTHRVGRTARAGRKGRAITLVGEADRKMLKAAIKQSDASKVRHRVIPADAIASMAEKLEELKEDVQDVLKEEREEKLMRQADMELKKGQNMVEHEKEIFGRPARTWFQSEKEKKKAQDAGKEAYVSGFPGIDKKGKGKAEAADKPKRGKYDGLSRKLKRRKMANEEDEERGDKGAILGSIRAAKKQQLPKKITEPIQQKTSTKAKKAKRARVGMGGFGSEDRVKGKGEGARAAKNDGVGLGSKKGKGKPGASKGKPSGKGRK